MDAAGRSGQNMGAARNTVFLFFRRILYGSGVNLMDTVVPQGQARILDSIHGSRSLGVIERSMLTMIGIVLLVVWLFDYAFHLAPGSLVHLLLVLAVIAFLLDFILNRGASVWDTGLRSNGRPPTRANRMMRIGSRWVRNLVRSKQS
jgi:hypothetical protein